MYPSAEVMDDDKFQSRSSDSFAASPQAIDVPTVNRPNIFNHNGKQEKLAHCQQNQACIAQFSCSDRPFDYGTACESSIWSAESPDLGIGWSFNANTGKCQSFYYGGCDGTLNIFKTQVECSSRKSLLIAKNYEIRNDIIQILYFLFYHIDINFLNFYSV